MWLSAVSRRAKFFSSSFTGIGSFKCQEPSGLDQQEVFVVQRSESQSVLIFIIVNSRDQNSFIFCCSLNSVNLVRFPINFPSQDAIAVIFITHSRSATLTGVPCSLLRILPENTLMNQKIGHDRFQSCQYYRTIFLILFQIPLSLTFSDVCSRKYIRNTFLGSLIR